MADDPSATAAHPFTPKVDVPSVCSVCDHTLGTDVHQPATAAQPVRCDHGKTAMESCLRCDPLNLLLWGHLPLAMTLHLRERFRAYRERPGAPDA